MGDIKLFQLADGSVEELCPNTAVSERKLHEMIECGMEKILGIKFLSREHSTGKFNRGYIDSLGLDENNCPVIVEYKRKGNENIVNQGLYYLDWLMDHKGDFTMLVRERLGVECAAAIEFSEARIICVASGFSRYDERAILQIGKNIELVRYRLYGGNLLLLELLSNSLSLLHKAGIREANDDMEEEDERPPMPLELRSKLLNMSAEIENVYFGLLEFAEDIGDDVSIKFLKHYVALTRLKNFASFEPQKNSLKLWLNLDVGAIEKSGGFCRDVSAIGHHGPGNVEIDLRSLEDLTRAKEFILLAYERA